MVFLNLCITLPPQRPGGQERTRWFKVTAFGTLASHTAESLRKGQLVTVIADDTRPDQWTGNDGQPHAGVLLKACQIGPCPVYDTAISGYREAAQPEPAAPEQAIPAEEQANRQVLAGVTGGAR